MEPERARRLKELAQEMMDIYLEDKDESPFVVRANLLRNKKTTNEIVVLSILIRENVTKSTKAAALPAVAGNQPTMQICQCCGGSGQVRK